MVSKPEISPYVWGHPLGQDSKVFYGRKDVFQFIQEHFWGVERNKIIALQGERRMGKTSILRQIEVRKILGNSRTVYFDLQGRYSNFKSIPEFLYSFARRVQNEARLPSEFKVRQPDFMTGYGEYYDIFEAWLDKVEDTLATHNTRVVILMDEFEKLLSRRLDSDLSVTQELAEEVLQYLRSMMLTRSQFDWIIAGSWNLVTEQRNYFSSLYGMALSYWVSYLDYRDAESLIREPVQERLVYDQDAVDQIIHLTGGHPFYIQILCDELFRNARETEKAQITLLDVNRVTKHALRQVMESSFHPIWASLSSSTVKTAISAIAELGEDSRQYIHINTVRDLLSRHGCLDDQALYRALDREEGELIRRGLVEFRQASADWLRIKTELLYMWLCKVKPFETVLKELR